MGQVGQRETKGQEREDREGKFEREIVGWERRVKYEGKKNHRGVTVLRVLGINISFRDLIG